MNNLVINVLSRAGHANNAYAGRQLGWDRTGGLRALELLGSSWEDGGVPGEPADFREAPADLG
jgi:hypothetical protein